LNFSVELIYTFLYFCRPVFEPAINAVILHISNKIGVALIVSNDYADNETELAKLNGTHKHADRMIAAFSKLGYAVFHCKI